MSDPIVPIDSPLGEVHTVIIDGVGLEELRAIGRAAMLRHEAERKVVDRMKQEFGLSDPEAEAMLLGVLLHTAEQPENGSGQSVPRQPPDGPVAPNLLWWKGEFIEMEPIPWRLLTHTWVKRTDKIENVLSATWGHDTDVSENAIKAAFRKANTALQTVRAPHALSRTRTGHVQLTGPE